MPVRTLDDGTQRCKHCDCDDSCRYRDGLQRTADLVAERLGLGRHLIAWQSAGRTADPWWGPPVEDVIEQIAEQGHRAVLVCSAGFVADHLEILYDLDIEARGIAESAGLRLRSHPHAECRPRLPRRARRGRSRSHRDGAGRVSASRTRRVVVVGGGVTGLTVAYRLMQADPEIDVTVLEAGSAAGGKLRSVTVGDFMVPAGADSFLARKPWAVELCRELGIELESPGATGAYLWTDTGLVPLIKDAPFGIPGEIGDLVRWPGPVGLGQAPCRAGPAQTRSPRR